MCPATETIHSTDLKRCFAASILLLAVLGSSALVSPEAAEDNSVLDLTAQPTYLKPWLRMPGSSIGGGPRGIYPPPYKVPLQVRIRAVRPSRISPADKFTVELLLHNIGEKPFYLPKFRDPWEVHVEGNKGRRSFLFLAKFFVPGKWEKEPTVVASTVAAETVPDSLLRLEPGQSVLVLLPGDLTPVADRLSPKLREISLQVVCKEWTLEDGRYYIKTRSHDLESENVFHISLQPENLPPHK